MEIVFNKVSYVVNKSTELEKTLLNDISFNINKSGIYSFIGPSNSGKSAIGQLIATLEVPSMGEVILGKYNSNGRVKGLKNTRSKIGFVNKNPYDMFFNKTVYEELSFGMKEFKYKRYQDNRVINALKLVNLNEKYLDQDPLSLNLVDAKKVSLACVLIYNPEVIVLDEFTNNLSTYDKKELIRLLRILKNKYNKTIILLSKDTSFCYEVTDYVYLMSITRLVTSGTRELLEDDKLLKKIGLEVPKIVSFVKACNKKGHEIDHYNNILDLIKGVYRDVY